MAERRRKRCRKNKTRSRILSRLESWSVIRLPQRDYSDSHPSKEKPWTLLSTFYSSLILFCIASLIYLILETHYLNCATQYKTANVVKTLSDISTNLTVVKNSYYDLAAKMLKFSQELPKIKNEIKKFNIKHSFKPNPLCNVATKSIRTEPQIKLN